MLSTLAKCAFFIFFFAAGEIAGQTAPLSARNLQQLLRPAGYVFAGRVAAVEYLPAKTAGEVATVRITLKVEQGIRGAKNGSTFMVREWAGLWNAGERYRVGERLLLFLYPRSRLGLTSAVGGPKGRLLVDRNDEVLVPATDDNPAITPRGGGFATHRIPLREFTRAIRARNAEQ